MALRLGLVGRGRWGRNIERTLSSFSDVSVTAIARGVRIDRGLDGVIVATPSATHAEVALPYIEQGIPTFIEKPIATSIEDALRIRAAARRSGTLVFVGHVHLYNPAFLALLDMLPALGAIRYVSCESLNDKPRSDSSVLWDWLPHHLSMGQRIFGKSPASVAAWGLAGGERTSAFASNFDFDGIPLLATANWLSPVIRQQLTVFAEKGAIVFDDRVAQKLALFQPGGRVSHPPYDLELPLTREMRSFVDMIRSGGNDQSHLELGVAVVSSIAAAQKSISGGGASIRV